MIVVDTSVWVEFFRGTPSPHARRLSRALDEEPLAITDLILCELLQGAANPQSVARIEAQITGTTMLESAGPSLARLAAHNYRQLRRAGYTVRSTVDCLIATLCLRLDLPLLHRDRDFDAFEKVLGLRVVHP